MPKMLFQYMYFTTDLFILTLLPLDKMATILQTIFSDAFSWMKVLYFDLNFTDACS